MRILNAPTTGPEVDVMAMFALKDDSGSFDDPYAGTVRFVLLTIPN
jgi:hypothetical protein